MADGRHIRIKIQERPTMKGYTYPVTISVRTGTPGKYMGAELDGKFTTRADAKAAARSYLNWMIADAALALQELER